jgi:hypothetical protein
MATEERVNIRISPEVKLDGIALGVMHGWDLSTLLRTLIIHETQKETKERPGVFKDARKKALEIVEREKQKAAQRNGKKRRVAITNVKANEDDRSSRIQDSAGRRASGGGRKR